VPGFAPFAQVHIWCYGTHREGWCNRLLHKIAPHSNHHDIRSSMVPERTTNLLTLVTWNMLHLLTIIEMIDVVIFQWKIILGFPWGPFKNILCYHNYVPSKLVVPHLSLDFRAVGWASLAFDSQCEKKPCWMMERRNPKPLLWLPPWGWTSFPTPC
jgi:hypothetical protein